MSPLRCRRPMRRVAVLAATAPLALAGCHGPRTAPEPVAAVAACPGPTLDTEQWNVISDSAGITYRVPADFAERRDPRIAHRQWNRERTASDSSSGYLWTGFIHSKEFWLTLRRAPSPGMEEMSECIDSVPGRQILVQAWRTPGGIFRDMRRWDRYDVFALVPVEPGLAFYVAGGGSDRRFQTVLLAIARTVVVSYP
jgi:hypothetical protein